MVVRTHPTLLLVAPVPPIHLSPKHATLLLCNLLWLPLPLEISTIFFFLKPGILWYPLSDLSLPSSLISCYSASYPLSPSPAELLFSSHTLCFPASMFCSAYACCRVCPFPLSLWKYDSFFTASSEFHLLSEVPLLPRIRCDPFHLLYTLHLIL